MSFTFAQLQRFSARAAAHRAAVFGATPGEASDQTPNVQIGSRRVRVAFTRFEQKRDISEGGLLYTVDATMHVPEALDITLDMDSAVVFIATGESYRVTLITTPPGSGARRYGLRAHSSLS